MERDGQVLRYCNGNYIKELLKLLVSPWAKIQPLKYKAEVKSSDLDSDLILCPKTK